MKKFEIGKIYKTDNLTKWKCIKRTTTTATFINLNGKTIKAKINITNDMEEIEKGYINLFAINTEDNITEKEHFERIADIYRY